MHTDYRLLGNSKSRSVFLVTQVSPSQVTGEDWRSQVARGTLLTFPTQEDQCYKGVQKDEDEWSWWWLSPYKVVLTSPYQQSLPYMDYRANGTASCPEGSCECPSCLVSMVVNNELIFFRKYSDPSTRKGEEPRMTRQMIQ